MSREVQEHSKFLRTIGHIFLWALGVVPLLGLFTLGVVVLHPYVAFVSLGIGVYLIRHSKQYRSRLGEIHDR